jgi:unsaturated rhamnogalacturonyl hydrolase
MSGIGEHHDRSFAKDIHKDAGWMTYWDPGDGPGERTPAPNTAPDGYVGTAVVMLPSQVLDAMELDGQMEMVTKATSGEPVNFWAGAGWDRSGDFRSYDDWKAYVAQSAQRIASPLAVFVSK